MKRFVEIFQSFFAFKKIYGSNNNSSKIRTIYINNENKPNDEFECDESLKYKSNRIKTSKYNLITFLPISIFEQFRRVANFYFLINITISFIIPNPIASNYLGFKFVSK